MQISSFMEWDTFLLGSNIKIDKFERHLRGQLWSTSEYFLAVLSWKDLFFTGAAKGSCNRSCSGVPKLEYIQNGIFESIHTVLLIASFSFSKPVTSLPLCINACFLTGMWFSLLPLDLKVKGCVAFAWNFFGTEEKACDYHRVVNFNLNFKSLINPPLPPRFPLFICNNSDRRWLQHLQTAACPWEEVLSGNLRTATVNLSQRIISGEAIFCSTLLVNCWDRCCLINAI